MKGISPLIAAVLLIAFTVAVGGIVSIFFTGFTKQTTGSVSTGGSNLVTCTNSYPTVSSVRYSASGSGMMNVTFSNPGDDSILNIIIYTAMSNGNTYSNSSGSLSSLATNSTQLFNINGLGTPTEVRIVGICMTTAGNQTVSGSCLSGQVCMKAV